MLHREEYVVVDKCYWFAERRAGRDWSQEARTEKSGDRTKKLELRSRRILRDGYEWRKERIIGHDKRGLLI